VFKNILLSSWLPEFKRADLISWSLIMFSPVRFLVNLFLYLEMFGLQKVSLYFDSPRKATCANVAEFSLNHYIAFLNSLYELTPYSGDIKKNCHVVYAT